MVDINLLPISQKQKKASNSLMSYITIGFMTIAAIMVAFAIALTTIRLTIAEKVANYNSLIDDNTIKMEPYKGLETSVTKVNTKLKTTKLLLDKQLKPTVILDQISGLVGSDIVLKDITIGATTTTTTAKTAATASPAAKSTSSAPILVTISGSASGRNQIVDFKRALENLTAFNNITYTITASTDAESDKSFSFSISANYTKAATQ